MQAGCLLDASQMPAGCRPDAGCWSDICSGRISSLDIRLDIPGRGRTSKPLPHPPGQDPWRSFSGVQIALRKGKGGGNQRWVNTPRDFRGFGGSGFVMVSGRAVREPLVRFWTGSVPVRSGSVRFGFQKKSLILYMFFDFFRSPYRKAAFSLIPKI